MDIMDKIKTIFKGIIIFIILYTVLSGNGDDTYFAWVLMFAALVLTVLFLDKSKNKVVLVGITAVLSFICYQGVGRAIPFLVVIAVLTAGYYFWGCKGDFRKFSESILKILNTEEAEIDTKSFSKGRNSRTNYVREWKAMNFFNPFERYAYCKGTRCIVVKKGIPPFFGTQDIYPISEFVNTNMMKVRFGILFCKVSIPVKYNANSHNPTQVMFCNITKGRYNELVHILSGRQ